MKKILFFTFLCFSSAAMMAQVGSVNSKLTKDDYFQEKQPKQEEPVKIKIMHADLTQKKADLFNGNTFMSGNVQLEHKGSILKADTVIFYSEDHKNRYPLLRPHSQYGLFQHGGNYIQQQRHDLDENGNLQHQHQNSRCHRKCKYRQRTIPRRRHQNPAKPKEQHRRLPRPYYHLQ